MRLPENVTRCHLFAGLTDTDLQLLATVGRLRECRRGDVLFEQGEEAAGFYAVGSGKVKIYKLSPEGKERILHVVLPGSTFADAAIFDDGCYPAFAEVLEKSTLVFFPKQDFLNLLHQHSQIAINIIGGLSRFLRQFVTQIEDLTFRDVPARLARFLIEIGADENRQVTLPFSKSQLASNLGTVSETLSRTFRKLADEEMIRVQGKTIEILDVDRLHDLADSSKDMA
ncbi:transcriptional regulator, Crp/Fnr family [Malonomonas rubra DSM 5091]|uniref:Transcriptional regulator, Crp/Fnr family n=1 Tax=Malonomonas rubra DSM 5091 TaxID=1122189 RepID=A0A1M6KBA5_MALRU|nr:Crp/Fnr family transcriptional regulator [Malonomonas rubra]SHJ56200.1 transcriptional regulator, Crp/Fnr family [Malonomonas rubra DSM 5091]